MATRIKLSIPDALATFFKPRKRGEKTPSLGVKKSVLKVTDGRKASRVRAYNKATAQNQWIIDQSGNRERYLRGEVTVVESRRSLREVAVNLGVAKPVRGSKPVKPVKSGAVIVRHATDVEYRQAVHSTVEFGKSINSQSIDDQLAVVTQENKDAYVAMSRAQRVYMARVNGKMISEMEARGVTWSEVLSDPDLSQLTQGMYH